MAFVQIIEFSTTRVDEVRQLVDEYRASTQDTRTMPVKGMLCADRDTPDRYCHIVEFESYETAMENSAKPETAAFAERMAKLCDGPATFRNLDLVEVIDT